MKSFLGERLTEATFGPGGIAGDRGLALRDTSTRHVLSAKKFSMLLTAHARLDDGAVTMTLPGVGDISSTDPDARARLSEWLGRPIEIATASGGDQRPTIEGDLGTFQGRPGGFFDSSAVHIVTTSTLAA